MDRTSEQEALFEHQLLAHIADALRTTIDWVVHTQDCSGRLPSLRFIAHSFQRHLEHILDLEEREGYLLMVDGRRHADLQEKIDELRREHDVFRQRLVLPIDRLERVSAADYLTVGEVCSAFGALLEHINDHNQREMRLIEMVREREQRDRLLGLL
jgi:hypothetical protein